MVKPARLTADDYASRISKAWQYAVESIIEAGRLLIEAKENLTEHGEFGDMIATKLPFSDRTAQMLMKVARHSVLSNPKHVSVLPASWGTLHSLARFPAEDLEALIADGKITPNIERSEVDELWADLVQKGIARYDVVRRNLNALIASMGIGKEDDDMQDRRRRLMALALYLLEDDRDGGATIMPDKLTYLSAWIVTLRDALQAVLDGEKVGGVTIQRSK